MAKINLFVFLFAIGSSAFAGEKSRATLTLKNGEVSDGLNAVTHTKGIVVDFAFSPDQSKLVYVTDSDMPPSQVANSRWILDLESKDLSQVCGNGKSGEACYITEPGLAPSTINGKPVVSANGAWDPKLGLAIHVGGNKKTGIDCFLNVHSKEIRCDP